jgi:hypothetical protein
VDTDPTPLRMQYRAWRSYNFSKCQARPSTKLHETPDEQDHISRFSSSVNLKKPGEKVLGTVNSAIYPIAHSLFSFD